MIKTVNNEEARHFTQITASSKLPETGISTKSSMI